MHSKVKAIIAIGLFLVFTAFVWQSPAFAESEIFVKSEVEVDESQGYFTLDFIEGVNVVTVTSSNTSIISVDDLYDSFVFLYAGDVGKVVITATDLEGNTDTCTVTVKPEPLELDIEDDIELTDYNEDESFEYYSKTNRIKSVVSSNKNIVKVTLEGTYDFSMTPISAGTAVITVTDVYMQTKTFNVVITQKYIDEMEYLADFEEAFQYVYYKDKEILFYSDVKNAEVMVVINGVTYTGVKDPGYGYVVQKIPLLPVGTTINYTIRKGQAVYTSSAKVLCGDLDSDGYCEFGEYDKRSYVYNGRKIKPAIQVYYYCIGLEDDLLKLKENVDYKVEYSNNLNVGKASVRIKGIGNYANSTTEYFHIIPKGTKITKVSGLNDSFKLQWKKQSARMSRATITGYQIQYSRDKKFKKATKVKTVKGYKKTSQKIRRLKSGKTYYVRVRTYMKTGGCTYYSKWSKVKKVKIH